jgi:hypothetical protein
VWNSSHLLVPQASGAPWTEWRQPAVAVSHTALVLVVVVVVVVVVAGAFLFGVAWWPHAA